MFGASKFEKRLHELEEQMLRLTRVVEGRDLDWGDMRARVKRLLDRTEKAAQRMETGVESGGTPQGKGEGDTGANGFTLTPSQAILQSKIVARRRLTT